jgi:predicted secreted Zn-dependent protease
VAQDGPANLILTRLGEVSAAVEAMKTSIHLKEQESRGKMLNVLLAGVGAVLTILSQHLFQFAGKEQTYIYPQFQVFATSLRQDTDAAVQRLMKARAILPDRGSTNYSVRQLDLVNALAESYTATIQIGITQASLTVFVANLDRDIKMQEAASFFASSQEDAKIHTIYSKAVEAQSCLAEASARLDTLRAGTASNASPHDYVSALQRTVLDIRDTIKGVEQTSACVKVSADLGQMTGDLVNHHDAGVADFNRRSAMASNWLKILSALGGIFLYVNGSAALRYIGRFVKEWFGKNQRN